MHMSARVLARFRFVALAVLALSLSLAGLVLAQQKGQPPTPPAKKYDKAQQKEIETLVKAVYDTMAGQPAPSDIPLTWQNHYLKARDQRTFVPFTLLIDRDKVTTTSVAIYLRVVPKGATVPAAGQGQKDPKEQKSVDQAFFENVHFVELRAEGQQPYQVTRALSAPPGECDVYLAIKERTTEKAKAPAKVTVLKQTLNVPDFWASDLTTSSIILAEKVEPIEKMPTDADMEIRPYLFGQNSVVPVTSAKYPKAGFLSFIFQVYNAAPDAANKPNIVVEYNFHQKAAGSEKFFNRTEPQSFNGSTLPPNFDLSAGHILIAGQEMIPLASFPDGDYRLEIKVTDKTSGKTVTRNVSFTVLP